MKLGSQTERDLKPKSVNIRIVHVSMLNTPLSNSPGFKSQLENEVHASGSLRDSEGIDWRTVLLVPTMNNENYEDFGGTVVKIPRAFWGRLAKRLYLWEYVRSASRQNDVVLVRHSVVDPFEPIYIRQLENVAVVHHTKSVDELNETGHILLAHVEAGLQWLNRRWARWPIGVTAELEQYASGRGRLSDSAMVMPNGVDLGVIDFPNSRVKAGDGVHALFVASQFVAWHGLDRLLTSLNQWSPQDGEHLTLHIVGNLTEEQQCAVNGSLKQGLEIRTHGMLAKNRIAELAGQVDFGIGSLALDRNKMKDACTLKVRDYLAAGLPVYATHRDSGLPDDFPYFYQDTTVNVPRMLSFGLSARLVERHTVRLAAEQYISKEAIMRRSGSSILRAIRDHARSVTTVDSSVVNRTGP